MKENHTKSQKAFKRSYVVVIQIHGQEEKCINEEKLIKFSQKAEVGGREALLEFLTGLCRL